jgi:uncharacterized repeat protein (TIGR01451 family)
MKSLTKKFFILTLTLLFVFSGSLIAYNESHTYPLQILTNIAKFTAANAATHPIATNRNVTVGTMFGGWMTNTTGTPQNITVLSKYTWTILFTNTGNSIASFVAKVVGSNKSTGSAWSSWARHFNNEGNLSSISPFGGTSFQFVISNTSPVPDGSWVSYQIMVSNTTAGARSLSYRAYQDTSGNWYGKNLGFGTNMYQWASGPVVYLQTGPSVNNTNQISGYLTVIIQGPILQISKSIQSVSHPSGIYSTTNWAEPGAIIVYKIWVSNAGSAAANTVRVRDTIPTNYVTLVDVTNGTILKRDTSIALPNVVFTNSTFNNGASDVLKIRVRVK